MRFLRNKDGNVSKKVWFALAYTICFTIIAGAVFSVFIINKKSFIWVPDGLQQHFNALLYYRSWLLSITDTLITEHRLSVPLWDMHIGLGSDVLTTLHYYVIGDPLNLLSVFVPDEKYMELFYNAMVLVRIYFAGLAFSAYCRYHGQKPYSTLLGAMVYDFCFWVIIAVRHPYFLNPMIYLPLILIGVDKIYKKQKPWLYMGMLAVATVSSFYFTYMICVFVVIYALLRYLMLFGKPVFKTVWYWVWRFAAYSFVTLSSVSIILLPVVAMTLSTGRAGAQHTFSLLYPLSYYRKLFYGFLIGGSTYWSELGYTGIVLLAVLLLLLGRRKNRGLRAGFVLMTLLLLFPFAGKMLNGGSYVVNRYMWAYSMLVSFIAVKMYPQMMEMHFKKKIALFWAGITYICLCLEVLGKHQKQYVLVALLLFSVLLVLIVGTGKKTKEKFVFKAALLVVVMLELIYQGWAEYAPQAGGYVEEFATQGEALSMLTKDAAGNLVKNHAKDTTYRYESLQSEEWKNTAMQLGINGTSYYFSLANPDINQFQREMYINQTRDFCYSGFDARTMLEVLSGVRYYVVPSGNKGLRPYGYNVCINRGTLGAGGQYEVKCDAYENDSVLPVGFAGSAVIPRSIYEKLDVTKKQQALLQGIIVEDDKVPAALAQKETGMEFTDKEISYEITDMHNVELTDQGFTATEKKASVTLSFEGMPESETYFILKGLGFSEEGKTLTQSKSRLHIDVTCGKITKMITFLTRKNNFYSGVDDYLINAGYRDEKADEIILTFHEKGTYQFDDMQIVCQPMEQIDGWTKNLKQDVLKNVVMDTNRISGTLENAQERLLCMTIPYSSGWRAYIDGVETEILKADTMYMAVDVPEGIHQIEFYYCTPYLKTGAVLSGLGILSVIGIAVFRYRTGNKRKKEQGRTKERI